MHAKKFKRAYETKSLSYYPFKGVVCACNQKLMCTYFSLRKLTE